MLELMRVAPRCVKELEAELKVSQTLISKHLRVLREQGLVEVVIDKRWRRYSIRSGGLKELADWMKNFDSKE